MSDMFISYSSQDRDFASRLVKDLEQYYEVWIDHGELSGGLEWEQRIEQALIDCKVFLAIVSEASNDSEWVARETIRAEQLEKFRIPVLLNSELPLRLLNLHYVDFRGAYEGGFRDLLEALQEHITPENQQETEAQQLIGEGIIAYLSGDYASSNSLIGQALVLSPGIADSIESFWQQVRREQTTNWADQYMSQIMIRERAELLREGDDADIYKWQVEIENDAELLEKIDYVQYHLHETFPKPIQIVRARDKNFPLAGQGWGTFDIGLTIYFRDGSVGTGEYPLQFENRTAQLSSLDNP